MGTVDRHDPETISALRSRTVDYSFYRKRLRFDLTHALFSSARVDAGTSMLLSLIAESMPEYGSVVDLGCGTGTLGISLAAARDVRLATVDRDVLALHFTRHNAALNEVEVSAATADPFGLASLSPPDGAPELVVSNLPAKAGEPVLRHLASQLRMRASLTGGNVAFVLVKPLERLAALIATDIGRTVLRRSNANHVAYLIEPREDDDPGDTDPLKPYIRGRASFIGPRVEYEAQTVYNLPEFDGLSFRSALAFDVLDRNRLHGPWIAYGIGQGHIAVGMQQVAGNGTVADRDTLALAISQRNLADRSGSAEAIETPWLGLPGEERGYSTIIINDDPVPESDWAATVTMTARRMLRPDGNLLLVSRSTPVARLLKTAGSSLRIQDDRRLHGFRAILAHLKD